MTLPPTLLPTLPHQHGAALRLTLALAVGATLAACGGGDAADTFEAPDVQSTASYPRALVVAPSNTLHVGVKLPGFPHKVDVYRPAGATNAVVFLHGHGGRNFVSAHDLGINRQPLPPLARNINWDWLSRNRLIAVFPQGQVKPGTSTPTWSNYVTDSGQDDVAFLNALAAHVKAQYGARQVSLGGHSAGGVMTARMWCEATTAYKAFVSLAGPMPSATYPSPSVTCTPLSPAPYLVVIGGKDTALPRFYLGVVQPSPEQAAAGLTDPVLVGEWWRHSDRSRLVCGEEPQLGESSVATSGPSWTNCGSRMRYDVVSNADHLIASLDANAGIRMSDLIAEFVKEDSGVEHSVSRL